jgi:hypothetical protein
MAGPFPGMDPYLECQSGWQDFRGGLIAEARNALGARLPDDYVARMGERIEVASFDDPNVIAYGPDVLVARGEKRSKVSRGEGRGAAITLEPIPIDVGKHDPEAHLA